MLGDAPASYGFGVKSQIKRHGLDFPWEHVRELLSSADILVGNLEAVLSESGVNPLWLPSLYMRGPSDCVQTLKDVGFDVLGVANNHMMQHGEGAFCETVTALESNGIQCIGSASAPTVRELTRNGIRFGFLGYSMRPEEYKPGRQQYRLASEPEILADVQSCAENYDHLVVSIHWGDEFVDRPSSEQQRLAHQIVDQGASTILGHHPHVLQAVEQYNGAVIAYSLGNFVFDMSFKKTSDTMILDVSYGPKSLERVEVIPVKINEFYQPQLVDNDAEQKIVKDRIRGLRDLINEGQDSNDYQLEVERCFREYRKSVVDSYKQNIFRFNPFYFAQLVFLVVLRRMTKVHI